METIKTTLITGILVLSGTSAFAGTAVDAQPDTTPSVVTRQVHVVKAPTLIKAGHFASNTMKRRVTKVMIEPVETLVARQASTSDHNRFLYQASKHANTNTKTYRPSAPKSETMPNLFKK